MSFWGQLKLTHNPTNEVPRKRIAQRNRIIPATTAGAREVLIRADTTKTQVRTTTTEEENESTYPNHSCFTVDRQVLFSAISYRHS